MHLISPAMYEKLKECLKEKQNEDKSIYQSFDTTAAESVEANAPIPGPSNINPATGEYWEQPQEIPDEFLYEDSTIEPTGTREPETPSTSIFESMDTNTRKRLPKTNDPKKIKSSVKRLQQTSHLQHFGQPISLSRDRSNLIVRRPTILPLIPEESEVQQDESSFYQPIHERSIADFSLSNPPQPIRTSTPKPKILQYQPPIVEPYVPDDPTFQSSFARSLVEENVPRQRTRQQRQIPLKSCKNNPKRVKYSEGESQMVDLPTLGKFKCDFCGKWFASKYSLNRHVKKYHQQNLDTTSGPVERNQPPPSPPPPASVEQFQSWNKPKKRKAGEAKLKTPPPIRKIKSDNLSMRKKRFDSWNL